MKCVIAGSRSIDDYSTVEMIVELCVKFKGFDITEVVCGGAPGVDTLGKEWADSNAIPVKFMDADWDDIHARGAVVMQRPNGKGFYNARAGMDRNERMAQYANAAIIIMDVGGSSGSRHMAKEAEKRNLKLALIQLTEESYE